MKFTLKDDLGIERLYYIVSKYKNNNEEYIIYTDLVNDNNNEYRLFVGQIINNNIVRINKEQEDLIIKEFKEL